MTAISIRKNHPEGFTLVEILVCLALMAITFVAVFRIQAQNLEFQREAGFITMAKYLSQLRLAKIYAGSATVGVVDSGKFPDPMEDFSYEEEVEEVEGREDLYEVKITIYQGNPGKGLEYVLETYVFQEPD